MSRFEGNLWYILRAFSQTVDTFKLNFVRQISKFGSYAFVGTIVVADFDIVRQRKVTNNGTLLKAFFHSIQAGRINPR
jgi:hypothetical protein